MYNDFASVYDQLMQEVDYDQWADYVYRLLLNSKRDVKKVLEFGSGTGNITTRLAQKGFDVTGVDISEEMLTVADNKADTLDLDVRFFLGDMSNFFINEKFDAIIATCDTVNYLESLEQVAGFIEGAYETLEPGGILLFDVNTKTKFDKTIGDNTFVYNFDDLYCVWESSAEEDEMTYEITFFVKGDDGRYDRFEEVQHQYAYLQHDIYRILKDVGFTDIKFYNFGSFLAGNDENDRMQISAIKPLKS